MGSNTSSNYLKALLLVGDITNESAHYYRTDCMTVQNFSYSLGRAADRRSVPYGPPNLTTLTATVKVFNKTQVRRFFELLDHLESDDFSFLFNATFDGDGMVANKEDAMLVRGMVVDIDEQYKSVADSRNQQMLLTFKLLVSSITYLGSMSNKILTISEI